MNRRILYVGGFKLPDKNAAAHRVIGIANALRDTGNEVVFLNYAKEAGKKRITVKDYFGFKSYEAEGYRKIYFRTSIGLIKRIIEKESVDMVIAYNYPSISLYSLLKYCKKRGIKVVADATEWDLPKGNPLRKLLNYLDIKMRMEKSISQLLI